MNITTLIHLAFDLAMFFAVVISYLTLRDQARIIAIRVNEAKALIDRLNHWHFSAEDRPKNGNGAEHDGGYRAPARTLLGEAVRDESADLQEAKMVCDVLSTWVGPDYRIIKSDGAYPWSAMHERAEYSGTTPASAGIKLTLAETWKAVNNVREAVILAQRSPSAATVKDVSAKYSKLAYHLHAIDKLYEHIDADKRQKVSIAPGAAEKKP